jgi:LacI family transcriptional regulator
MKLATGATMVSMQEVATRSRVSIATVSNFLNNPERVSEELRRRVADAIDELGYIRNEPARELRTGVSTALGFLAQELDNPVSSAVAVHLEKRASADGALLFIANTDGDPQLESRFLRRFAQQRVRGLILATGMTLDRDLHLLRRLSIPTILMDAYLPDDRFSSVAVDDRAAAITATRHLVGKGASHLCFVGFSSTARQVRERHQGMVDALSDVRNVRSSVMHTKDRSIAAGLHAAQQLLALPHGERPDAVHADPARYRHIRVRRSGVRGDGGRSAQHGATPPGDDDRDGHRPAERADSGPFCDRAPRLVDSGDRVEAELLVSRRVLHETTF